jgi:Flp pilus assembly pilin Flp
VSIEYGFVASMVFLAIVATTAALSSRITALYDSALAMFP